MRKYTVVFILNVLCISTSLLILNYLTYNWTGLFISNKVTSTRIVKAVEPELFANDSDFNCITARVAHLTFPMCLYKKNEDIPISNCVYRGGYYDKVLVNKFLQLVKRYDNVTFLDIGANLGTYSLPIAHTGIHVLAVEPNRNTFRRLAKSVHLGKIKHAVDLLNYAIGEKTYTTFIKYDQRNRGHTFLVQNSACQENCSTALVITLDSLIPLVRNRKVIFKVDAQESEIKIFTKSGAEQFFNTFEVPVILMEWVMYPALYGQTESKRILIGQFLEFFYNRSYSVYDPVKMKKLKSDWMRWPKDILLKKP